MNLNPLYQHIPIEERYEIFKEKCREEDIEPPTFEEFANRKWYTAFLLSKGSKAEWERISESNPAFRGMSDTAQECEAVSDIPESYFLKNIVMKKKYRYCVRLELCESEFFDNILANTKKEAKGKAIEKFKKRCLKDKNIDVYFSDISPHY